MRSLRHFPAPTPPPRTCSRVPTCVPARRRWSRVLQAVSDPQQSSSPERRGGHVIALAAVEKAAEVGRLGAARVLPRDTDLVTALQGQPVDVVVDVVGGDQFPALLQVLRRGGRYAVAGAIAGPIVELDLRTVYLKDLRLIGCTIPEPGVFGDLVGYIERNEIRPVVARTYPADSDRGRAARLPEQATYGEDRAAVCRRNALGAEGE